MPDAKPPEDAPAGDGGERDAHTSAGLNLLRGYQFRLIIDPANDAHFISCSAPRVRVVPIPFPAGGGRITHLFAGPVEHAEVVCEAGMTTSSVLWDWFQKSMDGVPERRNVSLVMLGAGGVGERLRWNLNDSWPCEWSASPVQARSREIAIETLVLCYESLTRGGKP